MPVYVMYGKIRLFGKNVLRKRTQTMLIRFRAARLQGTGRGFRPKLKTPVNWQSHEHPGQEGARECIAGAKVIDNSTLRRICVNALA